MAGAVEEPGGTVIIRVISIGVTGREWGRKYTDFPFLLLSRCFSWAEPN